MNKTYIFNTIDDYVNQKTTIIADLANLASILYHELEGFNWLGFYILNQQKDTLELGPFQGRKAVARINIKNGVCGHCVQENKTIIVNDVCAFPGHIACDINSKSEIVIPVYLKTGALWGLIDVDSPLLNKFTKSDQLFFEEIALYITSHVLTKLDA